ncbi:MAG: hypothetical protein RR495_02365 [Anaerovoracaceae bacterium]
MKKKNLIIATLIVSLVSVMSLSGAAFAADKKIDARTSATTNLSKYIEEISYDDEDRELSVDFVRSVKWSNPKIKISKGSKVYKSYIISRDRDDLEVRVNLTPGTKYRYTISGVKPYGASSYMTLTGTFVAYDD